MVLLNIVIDLFFIPAVFSLGFLGAYRVIDLKTLFLLVMALYVVVFFLIYALARFVLARSGLDYMIFRTLVRCMSRLDNAMGSAPVSAARRKAARQLSLSVRLIGRFSPIVPVAQYKRIMAQEAVRAKRALRQLNYAVMLGTDDDLKEVKETLAHATVMVATGTWLRVGDLGTAFVAPPTQRRAVLRSLLPWLAGIVIPLVASLITLLGQG